VPAAPNTAAASPDFITSRRVISLGTRAPSLISNFGNSESGIHSRIFKIRDSQIPNASSK
jgi:hypothetical protein